MKRLLVVLALGLLVGCNTEKKAPEAFTAAPLPAPTPTINTINPTLKPLPATGRGGIPDDSIKPLPLPTGRSGVPDDSVKPVPK